MANALYQRRGETYSFKASGGSVTFNLAGLGSGSVAISPILDLSAFPRPIQAQWRAKVYSGAALALGSAVNIYTIGSDGTTVDGNFGTAGTVLACGTATPLYNNMHYCGAIRADSTAGSASQQASGIAYPLIDPYVMVAVENQLGQTFGTITANFEVDLTLLYDEVQ